VWGAASGTDDATSGSTVSLWAMRMQRAKAAQGKAAMEAEHGPVVAKFTPGLVGAIRVYRDGTVTSMFGNGSVIGATAHVDQSGSQQGFRDTRLAFLRIEGPGVAISVTLSPKSGIMVNSARKFAAQLNQLSQRLTPATAPAPAPVLEHDPVEQIRKLAELRDQGVLTSDEFEAKKADLLGRL